MALAVGILWLAQVGVALALAAWLLWLRGRVGLYSAVLIVAGSLLCFGFYSAVVGLAENTWTRSSPGFLIAVAVGTLGEGIFVTGLLGLRRAHA